MIFVQKNIITIRRECLSFPGNPEDIYPYATFQLSEHPKSIGTYSIYHPDVAQVGQKNSNLLICTYIERKVYVMRTVTKYPL